MRPVINLKALNQWVETPYSKLEGLTSLRDLLKQGDWLIKVDLKDAYLTVPIHPDHQCYLHFTVEGTDYQFTCLPFGLVCAPWVFTKIMKAVVTSLRSWGTRMIIYIDDILIMSESALQAAQHLEVLTHILQCLGFNREIRDDPYPEKRISGHDCGLQYLACQSRSRQGKTNSGRSH